MGRDANKKAHAPLNAIRAFVAVAREGSVTGAASALGVTQSAVSRHLAVLEAHLGARLTERRGSGTTLTHYGHMLAEAVSEPLDMISFAVGRMRRGASTDGRRLVVRTSLPTFAYTTLVPNLPSFAAESGGATVDVVTSLTAPLPGDTHDVLIAQDRTPSPSSDGWDLMDETLVCAGTPQLLASSDDPVRTCEVLSNSSRPDILPRWLAGMGISEADITLGARYDHHYLALPAATTGQGLLIAPDIVVAGLVGEGLLATLPGTRVATGMSYRAYAAPDAADPDLARAFCRWLARLCRSMVPVTG